jgi:hypothetical protein
MRPDGHVPTLAVAVTLVPQSRAYACELVSNRGPSGHAAVVTERHASNSTDWTLIGVTAGRGVALLGTRHRYLSSSRRHHLGPGQPASCVSHLTELARSEVARRCEGRGHGVLPH